MTEHFVCTVVLQAHLVSDGTNGSRVAIRLAVMASRSIHSDVPSQAHSARFLISTRTHREVLVPMDRAEEKAGLKDVGEQALMRGLDTAFPFFRLGLSLV